MVEVFPCSRKGDLMLVIILKRKMGMGGATIHCRTGLDTPYKGPKFMDITRASVDAARKEKMSIWLYDEDRWPSGYGGGLVTQEKKYRARHLLWTAKAYGRDEVSSQNISAATAGGSRAGNGKLLWGI